MCEHFLKDARQMAHPSVLDIASCIGSNYNIWKFDVVGLWHIRYVQSRKD